MNGEVLGRTDVPDQRTLFELLAEHARVAPSHEAVVTPSERMTYGRWREAAAQVAAGLAGEGVGQGDRVALLADNRAAWLEIAMGAAALGAQLAPFNTWVKAWDLGFLLGHARPRVLFTIDSMGSQNYLEHLRTLVPELWHAAVGEWESARFPELRTVVVLGDERPRGAVSYEAWRDAQPTNSPRVLANPDDIALVLYTSGSTARPKAVPLLHEQLLRNGFWIGERQLLTSRDRVFLPSPLFWAYGGANALMASLTHRSTLVLQSQFRPSEALKLIDAEQCTSIYTLPTITHALLTDDAFDERRVASLRTGLTIGSRADVRNVVLGLGVAGICNIYGSSETYGNCCVTPSEAPLEERIDSQGPPLPGVEIEIADPESGVLVGPGEIGEIMVKGRVTPGYLDDHGQALPVTDERGFFATGDIGWLDKRGWLHFVGRSSEMIKTSGINVSPAEVEDFLLMHEDVAEVAVVAGKDPVAGEVVVAFVRPAAGVTTSPDELRAFCRSNMAGFKVPAVIRLVDVLPMTATGKLARRELRERADDAAAFARDGRGDAGWQEG